MIQSKRDLGLYIAADRIMNGRPAKRTLKEMVGDYVSGDQWGGDYQVFTRNENVCFLYEYHQERPVSLYA